MLRDAISETSEDDSTHVPHGFSRGARSEPLFACCGSRIASSPPQRAACRHPIRHALDTARHRLGIDARTLDKTMWILGNFSFLRRVAGGILRPWFCAQVVPFVQHISENVPNEL